MKLGFASGPMLAYTRRQIRTYPRLPRGAAFESGVMQVGVCGFVDARRLSQALWAGVYYVYFAAQPICDARSAGPRCDGRPTHSWAEASDESSWGGDDVPDRETVDDRAPGTVAECPSEAHAHPRAYGRSCARRGRLLAGARSGARP